MKRDPNLENRPHAEGPLVTFIVGALVGAAFIALLLALLKDALGPPLKSLGG